MTADFRSLCAELYAIFEKYDDESNLAGIRYDLKSDGNDILDRTRTALAEPVPPVPTDEELIKTASDAGLCYPVCWDLPENEMQMNYLRNFARVELAQPQPEPPTYEQLVEEFGQAYVPFTEALARAVLARWGNYPGSPDRSTEPTSGKDFDE